MIYINGRLQSSGSGGGPGSDTTALHQLGDTYGADIVIGTNDAHDLVFMADTATAWRIDHASGTLLPEGDKLISIGSVTKRVSRVFSDRFDIFSDTGGWVSSLSESGLEFGDGISGHATDVLMFRDPTTHELKATTGSGTYALTPGGSSPLTTKGDLFTFSTVAARLPVGTINGQILIVDSSQPTGLKWATGSGSVDATAWHDNLDTFGSAKKIGTVDDFGFAIYSHNINIGTFYDPRGTGAINGFSGMAFLSNLSVPGDSIYWLKNTDATPSASSSCELQFSSDVATLQIFTLNSNNPARAPGNPSYDMASNEAAIFAYDNPLDIVTGLDHPIQFILNGNRTAYMDKNGFYPQVDAVTQVIPVELGSPTNRWNTLFAYYARVDALTVGTFGTTAVAEGEMQAGLASGWRWFARDDGSEAVTGIIGYVGRDTVSQIVSKGGSGSAHGAYLEFVNTDSKVVYISLPESGYVKDAVSEANFFSIVGYTGIGVRVNVNGTDNSGWAIDSSGNMTIYAAQVGLYGHATVGQQTVTGSKASGAALASLLTLLANTGIVVDGSTT